MGQKANAPLLFETTHMTNFRSLGGYVTTDGRVTREGAAYRADALAELTSEDIAKIQELGITDVVDLRDQSELAALPNSLAEHDGFHYHHIPLFVDVTSVAALGPDITLGDMYIYLLDNLKDRIALVLRAILRAKGGAVFHCYAGKDRTGLTAMLLLRLAGVPDETIVADYAASYENIRARMVNRPDINTRFVNSDAANMRRTLAHLEKSYRDIGSYLLAAGLAPDEIRTLKNKLVG